MRLALLGCLLAALAGCPPTLSRPRSPAFEDALAEGERHHLHGRYGEAADAWARAAEEADRRVDRDEALYRRSRALRRAERYAEAVAALDAIVATRPPSRRTARALLDASRLRLQHLGERDAAREGFLRIAREFSEQGPAGRALYWLLRMDEQDGGGAAVLARLDALIGEPALVASPLGDDLLAKAGEVRLESGDRAGARRALERLVAEHPYPRGHRWDDAIVRLAEMDVEDGQPARAVERLEAMLERSETTTVVGSYTLPTFAQAQLTIARIQRDHLRDPGAAAASFRAVADDFPTSLLRDDALLELAEMQWEQGQRDDACDLFDRIVEDFELGRARRRAAALSAERCHD